MLGLWQTKISGWNKKSPKKLRNIKLKHILKERKDVIQKLVNIDDKILPKNVYREENEVVIVGTKKDFGFAHINEKVPYYRVKIIKENKTLDITFCYLERGKTYHTDYFKELEGYDVFSKYEDFETKEEYIGMIKNPNLEKEILESEKIITRYFMLQKNRVFIYNKPYNENEYSILRHYRKKPYAKEANRKLRRRVKTWIQKGDFDVYYKDFGTEKSIRREVL